MKWFQSSKGINLPSDITTGAAGVSSYLYIGFSDDTSGTGFTTDQPVSTSKYISFLQSAVPLSGLVYGDFGNWIQFVGGDGAYVATDPWTVVVINSSTSSYSLDPTTATNGYIFKGLRSGDYDIAPSSAGDEGQVIHIIWLAGLVSDANKLQFNSIDITGMANSSSATYYPCLRDTYITATYMGGGWYVETHPSFTEYTFIKGDHIIPSTVANSNLVNDHITLDGNVLELGGSYTCLSYLCLTNAVNVPLDQPKSGTKLEVGYGGTGLDALPTGILKSTAGTSLEAATADYDYITPSGPVVLTNKSLDANNNTITNISVTNLASTSIDTDLKTAATDHSTIPSAYSVKSYIDNIASGINFAVDCVAATTSDITIATDLNNGDVIDGITLNTNDRVLVWVQTVASENGIYVVGVSPARASDADSASEVCQKLVKITGGTVNANKVFICKNFAADVIIDTTDLVYEEVPFQTYTAGSGLVLSGGTFSVDTSDIADVRSAQTLTNKTLDSTCDFGGSLTGIPSFTAGADLDIGAYTLRALKFTSDVTTGTAPLTVSSTTVVTNLNADAVDGKHVGSSATNIPELVSGASAGKLDLAFLNKAAPSGVVVGTTDTQTLTNKTLSTATSIYADTLSVKASSGSPTKILTIDLSGLNASTSVLAVLSSGAETKTLIAGTYSIVGDTTSQTLTNKTLTAPTLTSPVINTGVSGTAVESTLTGTASILTTSAGIKTYVDNKWKVMSSVTRSDYKTFTSTTSILAGASLKYTNGSSTVYGIVVSVSGGPTYTYTIAGPDFPSGGTAAVSYCYNNTVEKTFVFSGLCLTATTNTLIATFNKSGYLWRHAPGYLVKTSAYLGTRLVTSPIINLRIGSSNVMTTGLTIAAGTTWYNSEDVGTASDIISANYSVVYSNNVEVAVTTASATSTDLTVSLLFVLS